MAARFWDKKFTQKILKGLRKGGYKVKKVQKGLYEAFDLDAEKVFTATAYRNGYLIKHDDDIFLYEGDVLINYPKERLLTL